MTTAVLRSALVDVFAARGSVVRPSSGTIAASPATHRVHALALSMATAILRRTLVGVFACFVRERESRFAAATVVVLRATCKRNQFAVRARPRKRFTRVAYQTVTRNSAPTEERSAVRFPAIQIVILAGSACPSRMIRRVRTPDVNGVCCPAHGRVSIIHVAKSELTDLDESVPDVHIVHGQFLVPGGVTVLFNTQAISSPNPDVGNRTVLFAESQMTPRSRVLVA